jgi:hypothetical protein
MDDSFSLLDEGTLVEFELRVEGIAFAIQFLVSDEASGE